MHSITGTSGKAIDVIIPAFNEEHAVHRVIADIPKGLVREVIVCNNGSTDRTAEKAHEAGATVIHQNKPGYGNACLAGIGYLRSKPLSEQPDIVVFIDADYSDFPDEMPAIVAPVAEGRYDMVIGSRALGHLEPGAMLRHQMFGNWLATTLIRLFYNYAFTDLGPFRAIRWDALQNLHMTDKNYGWTVEMQVKAAKMGLRCKEVPVRYRKRIGKSKVSGTVKGTLLAGHKIIWTVFRLL